jgi:allophanate hydrolase subunit 2
MKLSLDGPPPANGRTVPKDLAPLPGDDPVVRFIPGESAESAKLDGATVRLSVLQDRVGYRTEEPELAPGESSMQSEGIPPGTIQLPPDGKPIFLMADRPTTGGYPKLAFFASIDTRVIAQSPPGTRLHFKRITAEEGRRLIKEARDALKAIGGL